MQVVVLHGDEFVANVAVLLKPEKLSIVTKRLQCCMKARLRPSTRWSPAFDGGTARRILEACNERPP
jgi:hypothetical protein